eukprot:Clim_evm62s22 gene=Clim_evmTU62s22
MKNVSEQTLAADINNSERRKTEPMRALEGTTPMIAHTARKPDFTHDNDAVGIDGSPIVKDSSLTRSAKRIHEDEEYSPQRGIDLVLPKLKIARVDGSIRTPLLPLDCNRLGDNGSPSVMETPGLPGSRIPCARQQSESISTSCKGSDTLMSATAHFSAIMSVVPASNTTPQNEHKEKMNANVRNIVENIQGRGYDGETPHFDMSCFSTPDRDHAMLKYATDEKKCMKTDDKSNFDGVSTTATEVGVQSDTPVSVSGINKGFKSPGVENSTPMAKPANEGLTMPSFTTASNRTVSFKVTNPRAARVMAELQQDMHAPVHTLTRDFVSDKDSGVDSEGRTPVTERNGNALIETVHDSGVGFQTGSGKGVNLSKKAQVAMARFAAMANEEVGEDFMKIAKAEVDQIEGTDLKQDSGKKPKTPILNRNSLSVDTPGFTGIGKVGSGFKSPSLAKTPMLPHANMPTRPTSLLAGGGTRAVTPMMNRCAKTKGGSGIMPRPVRRTALSGGSTFKRQQRTKMPTAAATPQTATIKSGRVCAPTSTNTARIAQSIIKLAQDYPSVERVPLKAMDLITPSPKEQLLAAASLLYHRMPASTESKRAGIKAGEDDRIGWEELRDAMLNDSRVISSLVTDAWTKNHYKWIVQKLMSMDRAFGAKRCKPANVLDQLRIRYEVEVVRVKKSAVKKICEGDVPASVPMVLFISKVLESEGNIVVELSDGWYAIPAKFDSVLSRAFKQCKLRLGSKIFVCQSDLVVAGGEQQFDALDVPGGAHLRIFGNSSRRVQWHMRLGIHQSHGVTITKKHQIMPGGGLISRVRCFLMRQHAVEIMLLLANGDKITLSERSYQHLMSLADAGGNVGTHASMGARISHEAYKLITSTTKMIPQVSFDILLEGDDPDDPRSPLKLTMKGLDSDFKPKLGRLYVITHLHPAGLEGDSGGQITALRASSMTRLKIASFGAKSTHSLPLERSVPPVQMTPFENMMAPVSRATRTATVNVSGTVCWLGPVETSKATRSHGNKGENTSASIELPVIRDSIQRLTLIDGEGNLLHVQLPRPVAVMGLTGLLREGNTVCLSNVRQGPFDHRFAMGRIFATPSTTYAKTEALDRPSVTVRGMLRAFSVDLLTKSDPPVQWDKISGYVTEFETADKDSMCSVILDDGIYGHKLELKGDTGNYAIGLLAKQAHINNHNHFSFWQKREGKGKPTCARIQRTTINLHLVRSILEDQTRAINL